MVSSRDQNLALRVTELERQAVELRLFRTAFDLAGDAITVTDADNRIVAVNAAFTRNTGYESGEEVGRSPDFLTMGLHEPDFFIEMCKIVHRTGYWEGEVANRRRSGEVYRERLRVAAERDESGRVCRHVYIAHDITDMHNATQQLWRQNNYDPLTELPNRSLLLDRLLQALVLAGRDEVRAALLFVGLDGFKTINDTLGHTVGDMVLREVARRFQGAVRQGDTLGRFGGDEFTVVLTNVHSVDAVEAVVRALMEALHEPLLIEAHQILLSCSIGISLWPGDGEDVENLQRNATSALQQAKQAGRATFRFFTPDMDARAQARTRLAGELSDALANNEFSLVYQPMIDVGTGRVAGAEALLRWHNRYIGAVGPDQFVPLAEEMGMILPIGRWLLSAACMEAASWKGLDLEPLKVAVNVSARQVQQTDIATLVELALAESGLPPELLTVEITESLILGSGGEVVKKLQRIRNLGAHIAVDDFGTGYASLSYLKHFPVDILKIDRTFVADALDNPEDARLIEAIIALGHSLNMKVVGEGVESVEQMVFLAERGCDLVQGYRFSPPLVAERFRSFVLGHR
jgi:diguanylate cyclase (GGDEF)-like protein/PAS domain S-box-containing protein